MHNEAKSTKIRIAIVYIFGQQQNKQEQHQQPNRAPKQIFYVKVLYFFFLVEKSYIHNTNNKSKYIERIKKNI